MTNYKLQQKYRGEYIDQDKYNTEIANIIKKNLYNQITTYIDNIKNEITKNKKIDKTKFKFYDTEITLNNVDKYTNKQLERRCLFLNNGKTRIVKTIEFKEIKNINTKINKLQMELKTKKIKTKPNWLFNKYESILYYKNNKFAVNSKIIDFFNLDKTKYYSKDCIVQKLYEAYILKILDKKDLKLLLHMNRFYDYNVKYSIRNRLSSVYNNDDFYVKPTIRFAKKYKLDINKIYLLSELSKLYKDVKLQPLRNYMYPWVNITEKDKYYKKSNIIKKIKILQKFYKKYFNKK